MGQVTRSLRIEAELWTRAKVYCAENNLTLSEWIESLIASELDRAAR